VTGKLYKVSAYLNAEELREFNRSVMARAAGQSGFIREMLGFEIRPRGAPKGPRKKKPPEAGPTKKRAAKTKAAVKKKAERKRPGAPREQLSFLD
jgi:hypothetical protein